MKQYHNVQNLRFSGDYFIVTIDGEEKRIRINDISILLGQASEQEKNTFEISPSGYGIHWPMLDEDISIDGLLGIAHQRASKERQPK
jgi:hypothetical protein